MISAMATRPSAFEQIVNLLPELSRAERLTLLREIEQQVQSPALHHLSDEEFVQQIDPAFGLWADRTDLPEDSIEYVRQLRAGWKERFERLG